MVALPPKDLGCHRTGFEKKCRDLVCGDVCNRYVTFEFTNKATGEVTSLSDCADNWPTTLLWKLIEQTANGSGGVQAAVESFRNEMVELNNPGYDSRKPRVSHTQAG